MTRFEWIVVVLMVLVVVELEFIRLGHNPLKTWWRDRFGRKYGRDFV